MKEHEVVQLTSHVCITCAKELVTKEDSEEALQSQTQDIKKKVEGMKKELPRDGHDLTECSSYNQALSDVIKILEE